MKQSGPYLLDVQSKSDGLQVTICQEITDFLLHLFQDKNIQPSTIDGYRSDISDKIGNSSLNILP